MKQQHNRVGFLKVAIVYDWLDTPKGGAELVLKSLVNAFPNSTIYTSFYSLPTLKALGIKSAKSTFLQKLQALLKSKAILAPFFPIAFESLDLSGEDLVISVTSSFSKGVITNPNQLHISYVFTPPRYLYSHQSTYLSQYKPLMPLIKPVVNYLKKWDKLASNRPDHIFTLSKLTAARMKKHYPSVKTQVLTPPIPSLATPSKINSDFDFYLVLSRLVRYKKIDLAISAAIELNKNLLVIGTGPELSNLLNLAGKKAVVRQPSESFSNFLIKISSQLNTDEKSIIAFAGTVNENDKSWALNKAKALIMPGEEDFGITALEAASVGTPSVLHHKSGAAELFKDGKSAVFIEKNNLTGLKTALKKLKKLTLTKSEIKMTSMDLSNKKFESSFKELVSALWKEHNERK